ELYGAQRVNSAGIDLASEPVRARIAAALQRSRDTTHHAGPIVPGLMLNDLGAPDASRARTVANPADQGDIVGHVVETDGAEVETALAASAAVAASWAHTLPAERAACLERAAELLERHADELLALAVREAGKSWSNAVAEL